MNGADIELLNEKVVNCVKCPRLVHHREETARVKRRMYRNDEYWGRPLTGFGAVDARLLLVGLAPAAHGGNRTGRMFTGDRSGDWLYGTLHKFGFASQPTSEHKEDGLELIDAYVTAAVRCAPPDNKPSREEMLLCRPYLAGELRLLSGVRVVAPLGKIAFDSYLKARRDVMGDAEHEPKPRPKFGHGETYTFPDGVVLLSSYHPSQQNTQTGRLTREMFEGIFARARRMIDGGV